MDNFPIDPEFFLHEIQRKFGRGSEKDDIANVFFVRLIYYRLCYVSREFRDMSARRYRPSE